MIKKIQLNQCASFKTSQCIDNLSRINFFYGSNGSGKTTVSRVIANENHSQTCKVKWLGAKLKTVVYNKDFIDENFNQSRDLKGVFTLGEKDQNLIDEIKKSKNELSKIDEKIDRLSAKLNNSLEDGGIMASLSDLENEFKETCWKQKLKHDKHFSQAFSGYRNDKERFKKKILESCDKPSEGTQNLEKLKKRSETVFGNSNVKLNLLPEIDINNIKACESSPIMGKHVLGKEDVDIAGLIQKLGNSDWVDSGLKYLKEAGGKCPFCQQEIESSLREKFEKFFDESYDNDKKSIKDLEQKYSQNANDILLKIKRIAEINCPYLSKDELNTSRTELELRFDANIQKIKAKSKEPSKPMLLKSVLITINEINTMVLAANSEVADHNNTIENLGKEQENLTNQVWDYICSSELQRDIEGYQKKKSDFTKAMQSINENIITEEKNKQTKDKEIRNLESQITSVQPTVDAINSLLTFAGFSSFKLAKAGENQPYYKLVRPDNTSAKETLSEGEKTFITFLYFYHLLKGSKNPDEVTQSKVVVFDDPISSLDSDILFIVGSLIKELFLQIRENNTNIKQIFVFTHNVYFHKEVTFNPHRRSQAMNEETFWIIRKLESGSTIEQFNFNPIKTSYELLWEEIRKPDTAGLTIQNTIRRILENYFKIFGGVDPDDICKHFEGAEKIICKSLFSWVNDGSHFAQDGLYVPVEDSAVQTYLDVFEKIFIKLGHHAHYQMMMRGSVSTS